MLHYSLYKNNLISGDPENLLARPTDVQSKSRTDLIEDITGPGSILKPTESEAVIKSYWRKITDYIRQGKVYRDEYVSTRFSIRGFFEDEDDEFDPDRHELIVSGMLKTAVTGVASEVPLRKVDGNRIVPVIDSIYDWGSETTGNRLTPGNALEVTGSNLKIHDNLEKEEGVFFVSQSDESEFRATQLRINEPKTLTLRIPEELTPGNYRLQVRNTSYNGNTIRRSIFSSVLTVS